METVEVRYQGEKAAAISFESGAGAAQFEYYPEFVEKGIPLAPLTMPLKRNRIYQANSTYMAQPKFAPPTPYCSASRWHGAHG